MDLKIEIRKLYALHEATIRYDHAIREIGQTTWTDFTPSHFIYAYFTFNSIYSYDWRTSFTEKRAVKWTYDKERGFCREEEKFKDYLRFLSEALAPDAPKFFAEDLNRSLNRYGVKNPHDELQDVDVVNATTRVRNLAKQLPGQLEKLRKATACPDGFFSSASAVFSFVYEVRCNLFHGSKTQVQLLNPKQARRLLIYTATLIAGNSMLFRLAEKVNIGWKKVEVNLRPGSSVMAYS